MDKESLDKLTEAFGFREALDALDRLVDMATVGGHKEKAEKKEPVITSTKYAANRLAEIARELYTSFCEVGFDCDEAFSLTLEIYRQSGNSVK